MNRLIKLFALALFAAGAAACQTIQGAGQDIENAGEALEDAADN